MCATSITRQLMSGSQSATNDPLRGGAIFSSVAFFRILRQVWRVTFGVIGFCLGYLLDRKAKQRRLDDQEDSTEKVLR